MKKPNNRNAYRGKRRLLFLLSGLLIVAAAAVGTYAYRAHRLRAQIALWKVEGMAAAQRGDPALAVERLTSYLSYNPSDREALLAYADCRPLVDSSDGHHLVETARALRYLVQLDPGNLSYHARLLDLYWKLGLRTESVDAAGEILKIDPKNAHALEIQSAALIAVKNYNKALDSAARWAQLEPTNLTAQYRVFALQSALGHSSADVLANVETWGKHHPDDPARYELLRSCAYSAFGDRENALTWLRQAAKWQPPDDAFADLLIDQFDQLGDGGEDINVLKDLVSRGAGQRIRQRLLGRLWELSRYRDVLDLAKGMDLRAPAVPVSTLAVTCLAYLSSGHAADAAPVREILRLRTGAVAAAWNTILNSVGNQPAIYRAMADACKRALGQDPRAPYLHYFLGEALAALGENQLAIEAWQREGAVSPAWGIPLARMAELLLDQGNTSRAVQVAVIALKRDPTAVTGLVVARVAVAMLQEGQSVNRDSALNLINQLEKLMPADGSVRLLDAQMLAATGKKDQATAVLREFLRPQAPHQTQPDSALLLRAASISQAAQLGLEQEFWKRDEQLHGMSPMLAFEQARVVANDGDPRAALKMFEEARARSAARAAPAPMLDWELARARLLELADDPAAGATWRALGDGNPNNLAVQRAVLGARSLINDRSFRERTIARLAALAGQDSLVCALARAQLLIENRGSDADDRDIAETLKRIITTHPSLPQPRLLLAAYLERAGKIDEAIDQLQLAANSNPDLVSLAMRLSELYRKKGDYDRAKTYAERVAASKGSTPAEVRAAAQMLAGLGDNAEAVSALEQLSAQPTVDATSSVGDELMLAGLYWDRGQLEKTDTILSRLLAEPISARQPDVLALAARFYASQGKAGESARILILIDALSLPAGRKDMIHADTLAASGDVAGAERCYRQATAVAPSEPAMWRSLITYLYETRRAVDAASAIDTAIARLGSNPPLAALKQAASALAVTCQLDELGAIMRDYLQDPLNRAASSDILSAIARASDASADDAAAKARTLSQQYPRIEGVQLWAIRTYLRTGRFADAAPAIARIVSDFPQSPKAAAVAATFYASQSKWPETLEAAQQWRSRVRGPASGEEAERADTCLARALLEVGRDSDAVELLKPRVSTCLAQPGRHVGLLVTYADSLRATGQTDEASKLLPLAAGDAAWRGACIRFAAEKLDPKVGSAWLARLEPWARAGSVQELCQAADAWAILSSRSAGQLEYATHAERLFAEIEQNPSASGVAIEHAGVFAERSGNIDEAIALYRHAIALDPHESVALNNLAVILANRGQARDGEEAGQCAAAALRAHPDAPELLDTLAFVNAKARDYPPAIRAMARAIELEPENMRWRVGLAQLLADSGDKDQAQRVVATIDTMGMDQDRLAPTLRHQLQTLRARLHPAADALTTRPAITASTASN